MKNRWKVLIAAMGLALVTAAPATAELKIGVIEPQRSRIRSRNTSRAANASLTWKRKS